MKVSNTSANNNEAVSLLMDDDDKEKNEGNTCLIFFSVKYYTRPTWISYQRIVDHKVRVTKSHDVWR